MAIGEDGQVFAIDVKDCEIPYLVISTEGRQIPYEPKISATLKVYEKRKLTQKQLIGIEFRGKTFFRLSDKRTYTDFIDVESFVDYFIINELCRNVDAYRLSTFLQKDRDGKLAMGPVWDMNIGFDEGDRIPIFLGDQL